MGGIGVWELVVPVLVVGLSALIRAAKSKNVSLVLQKFDLKARPHPEGVPTVEIVGRTEGIIGYILSLFGFSPITRFTMTGGEVRCQSASLFGQRSQFVPLRSVANLDAGVQKPISSLIAAVVILVLGMYVYFQMQDWLVLLAMMVLAGACVAKYFFSKKFYIEIYGQAGPAISLLFKPNVLEGVPIDIERAISVIAVIRDLIIHHREPGANSGSAPGDRTESAPRSGGQAPPVESQSDEAAAEEMYAEARQLVQSGQRPRAISQLQELIRRYPNTAAAEQSRKSLEKIGALTH